MKQRVLSIHEHFYTRKRNTGDSAPFVARRFTHQKDAFALNIRHIFKVQPQVVSQSIIKVGIGYSRGIFLTLQRIKKELYGLHLLTNKDQQRKPIANNKKWVRLTIRTGTT